MKRWLTIAVVTAAVGAAGLAWAAERGESPDKGRMQGPGGRGPGGHPGAGVEFLVQHPDVAREAGVTDDQIAKLRTATYEMRKQMIKLEADEELAKLEVDQLMDQPMPDRQAIDKAIDEAGKAETAIEKARVQHKLAVEDILGAETTDKLHSIMREKMEERRHDKGDRGPRWQDKGDRPSHGEAEQGERGDDVDDAPQGAPPAGK